MSGPPVVLDTCVFRDKHFLYKLAKYRGDKILPPVALSELTYHFLSKGKEESEVHRLLRAAGIEQARMGPREATAAARFGSSQGEWSRKWRDYMIGAHAEEAPILLITHNIRDFTFIPRRVLAPPEFCDTYGLG